MRGLIKAFANEQSGRFPGGLDRRDDRRRDRHRVPTWLRAGPVRIPLTDADTDPNAHPDPDAQPKPESNSYSCS